MVIHRSLLTAGLAAALVGGLGLAAFSQTTQSQPPQPGATPTEPAQRPEARAEVTVKGWPMPPSWALAKPARFPGRFLLVNAVTN